MKHIIKVNNIQDAKDNPTRPLIAMDNNGILFAEGKAAVPQIEFVDLGLSVKWGKSLLGATNGNTADSWYGNYYAWGEIETKTNYEWSNYKYANGSENALTKYCTNSKNGHNGFTDDLTQLVRDDDAATQTNPAWRMPTKAEFEELMALPNQWVTNYNEIPGLNGRVFEGKNGNQLFIPAAGSYNSIVGSSCYLWSSSLYSGGPRFARSLYFYSHNINISNSGRFVGYNVCPVSY